ncbi:MAG: hypothetical protein KJ041_04665, partial [Gammaproteobacteria bacterium]|nr:hypothetical protein [Gammaproteobacteria bacterium]
KVGGTPMLVGAEGAPLLVDAGDTDGLSRRLAALVEDAGLRLAYGAAMRERIRAHFAIERVAATYAEAYRLLASGRRHDVFQAGNPIITRDQPGSR